MMPPSRIAPSSVPNERLTLTPRPRSTHSTCLTTFSSVSRPPSGGLKLVLVLVLGFSSVSRPPSGGLVWGEQSP